MRGTDGGQCAYGSVGGAGVGRVLDHKAQLWECGLGVCAERAKPQWGELCEGVPWAECEQPSRPSEVSQPSEDDAAGQDFEYGVSPWRRFLLNPFKEERNCICADRGQCVPGLLGSEGVVGQGALVIESQPCGEGAALVGGLGGARECDGQGHQGGDAANCDEDHTACAHEGSLGARFSTLNCGLSSNE